MRRFEFPGVDYHGRYDDFCVEGNFRCCFFECRIAKGVRRGHRDDAVLDVIARSDPITPCAYFRGLKMRETSDTFMVFQTHGYLRRRSRGGV